MADANERWFRILVDPSMPAGTSLLISTSPPDQRFETERKQIDWLAANKRAVSIKNVGDPSVQ